MCSSKRKFRDTRTSTWIHRPLLICAPEVIIQIKMATLIKIRMDLCFLQAVACPVVLDPWQKWRISNQSQNSICMLITLKLHLNKTRKWINIHKVWVNLRRTRRNIEIKENIETIEKRNEKYVVTKIWIYNNISVKTTIWLWNIYVWSSLWIAKISSILNIFLNKI